MGDKYLNEGCKFICDCGIGANLFKTTSGIPSRVNLHNKSILTNETILVPEIDIGLFCMKQPNPQGNPPYFPCKLKSLGVNWKKCSKNKCGGRNLLTEQSKAICNGFFGELTVKPPVIIKCVQDINAVRVLSPASNHQKQKTMEQRGNNGEASQKAQEKKRTIEDTSDKTEIANSIIMKCPYSPEKEKCRTCGYLLAKTDRVESALIEGSSKTPSMILRENYEKNYGQVKSRRKYLKNFENYMAELTLFDRNRAGNQAHHIISAKDVLMKPQVEFVLKLVNYYGWDVNNAFNCILLAGNKEQGDFKGRVEDKKTEEKYQIMNTVKRQWHGGGHEFSVHNSEEFEGDYATLVTDKLMEVMNGLSSSFCRRIGEENKYYEKGRTEFINRMNVFIDYICDKLADFEKNPRNSHPFYVSADAFQYSYGIPENWKFLVVRYGKIRRELKVYKYIAMRKEDDTRILKFDFRGEKNFLLDEYDQKKKAERSLVMFCEQIDTMILDKNGYDVQFPFSVTNIYEVSIKELEVKDYLVMNANAIGVFLSKIEKCNQKNCMRRRLLELNGDGG